MDELELIFRIVSWPFGWLLRGFRRWIDRLPDRDPSQLSLLHRLGRMLLAAITLALLAAPVAWLIWR